MIGILVVLLARIEDIMEEVSMEVVLAGAAKEADEVVVLSDVPPIATPIRMAVSMPMAGTWDAAVFLRKQSEPLLTALG